MYSTTCKLCVENINYYLTKYFINLTDKGVELSDVNIYLYRIAKIFI